jgi:TolB protein
MLCSKATGRGALITALLAVLAALPAAGCGSGEDEGVAIRPAQVGVAEAGPGLGPGVRPLSLGPGDKGSPRVSPSGDRVAFILNGSVLEKPLFARSFGRRTEDGFDAERAEWLSGENLAVLGREAAGGSAETGAEGPTPLFLTRPGDAPGIPPGLLEISEGVGAVGTAPEGGAMFAAETPLANAALPAESSKLLVVRGRGQVRFYPGKIPGRVTGLSVSPDGREAVLALAPGEGGETEGRVELLSYRFPHGPPRRAALLPDGIELLGSPQWTSRGIHFVAGEEQDGFVLYRVPRGSDRPEPVRDVGEGFLPAGICSSPEGDRLAVVGRRSPDSPTNLYVLDLASEALETATANEDMEVKTNPQDLTWSPDGSYVVLVARGVLSGPETYDAPAASLSSAFYNLYRVPVGGGSG